jgi:hypothetical protein
MIENVSATFLVTFSLTVSLLLIFKFNVEIQNGNNENINDHGNKYLADDFNRDNNLKKLVHILNNNSKLFQNWDGTEKNYVDFIHVLEPYILMPPAFPKNPTLPFIIPISNKEDNIDCMNPKYSGVLTGKKLNKSKFIIDFVPFGYDIDKLELRLYEYYDLVDVIVIYESPRTLSGLSKPLYYQEIKDDARFKPFKEKIIYLSASAEELKEDEKSTRAGDN